MQSSEICFELQRGPVCALLPLIFSHVFIYSNMKFFTLCLLFLLCVPFLLSAQPQDTVHFQWPNQPFNSSHFINGTFCEYRNTLSANHFHSGVDIGEPDGNPIYPCLDGIVYSYSTSDGDNNFVRVKSFVGGQWKHISYVHIQPRPGLSVGDSVVAGSTILGTIIPGLGHVHLTERELVSNENATGVEINAIRFGGGLDPFIDTYPPVIDQSQILFRQVTTNSFLPSNSLFGNVEFIVKVNEHNGTGPSQVNNGTYQLGYRILSDSLTVVYEPPDAGVRFRFDRKPFDDYADNVFVPPPFSNTGAHYYRLTSGLGANDVHASRTALLGSVDVSAYPEGNYLLQIFTQDTRANVDTALLPIFITDDDLVPPGFPTLTSAVIGGGDTITVSWIANSEPDLGGYRLHYFNGSVWQTASSELILASGTTSISFSAPPLFLQPSDSLNKLPLALTAVDTTSPPNESARSDVYSVAFPWFTNAPSPSIALRLQMPILVVDGFDRFGGTGSWASPTHDFAKLLVDALPALIPVSTCSNEAVISGSVDLNSYKAVFWLLGDESTENRTLTAAEQAMVKKYLESGGNLFISGSEIGWDLGRPHTRSEPGDLAFYQNYLKAQLMYDGDAAMTAAQGIAGSIFEGLTVTIGQTYPEDYPDDIEPINGASPTLIYNAKRGDGSWRLAGISFAGTFGAGTTPGKLVYLSFPFETIGSATFRNALIQRVVTFFGIPTGVFLTDSPIPATFALSQNYPNPFNPSTRLTVNVPFKGSVSLKIYDMLGREITRLLAGDQDAGSYVVEWDAASLPSGTYFAVADFGTSRQIRKLLLVK